VAANTTDAGEDLAGHEKWVQALNPLVEKLVIGADEIVFMAAKGVTAEVVDRVVVDVDGVIKAELVDGADDVAVAGSIIGDEVFEVSALGGRVLEMAAHRVDVKAGAVHEEAAASGRFEYVVAGVKVYRAQAKLREKVVLDRLDGAFRSAERVVADEGAELGFDAKDPFVGKPSHRY
jgi:hypothetical protein